MKKAIDVYWAPSLFDIESEQWNLFYSEPQNVYQNTASQGKKSELVRCPAFQKSAKNLYQLNSMINDTHTLGANFLEGLSDVQNRGVDLDTDGTIGLVYTRPSSLPGYINLSYNLGWYFIAEEPLNVKLSAPYFPSTTPAPGALLAFGEFDIGQWHRPIALDYHIPINTEKFEVQIDQPLAFLEFDTDKKINFKRFVPNRHIREIMLENTRASQTIFKKSTLKYRYERYMKSGISKLLLNEIKNNLVVMDN